MSEVLAKVTARTLNVPRGPDVTHRIRVPRAWFEAGEVIEFELPRNVTCAACDGGGCDACERSGAITLRGRQELAEILSVSLPVRKGETEIRSVVIRIPEQGGLSPNNDEAIPRGLLLLRVEPAEVADPGVSRKVPSARPLSLRVMQSIHSLRIPESPRGRARWFTVVALLITLAGLAILAFWRHRGLG
ncbi:MAG TPA: hypothetical protein VER96_21355 [Polyangiaceae bacterium]|nr:hypothetical protein [Polyangiaceae bacterium]